MSESGEQHDPRMEQLLRRWGGRKAAEASRPPAMPELNAPPARRSFWKWSIPLPVAVASMVLVAAATLFLNPFQTERTQDDAEYAGEPAPAVLSPMAEIDSSSPAEEQKEIRELKVQLAQSQAAYESTQHFMKRWTRDRDRLHDAIDKLMADLKTKNGELRELLNEKDMAGAALAEQSKKIMVLQDAYAQQMLVFRDQKRLMLKLYLQASVKDKEGVSALQDAIHNNELIARCGRLRRIAGPSDAVLLDRIEGVLTRLCLLGPHDAAGLASLRDTLEKTKLAAAVEKKMAAASSESSTFWVEISLILMGVDYVA